MQIPVRRFFLGAIFLFAGIQASSIAAPNPQQIQAIDSSGAFGLESAGRNLSVQPRTAERRFASASGSGGTSANVVDRKGLLSGCTVGPDNQPSCQTPAGWTLVIADGFEGDKLANPKAERLHVAQIECSFAHSGSCAVGARYVSNGNSFRWILSPGVIGNSDEVYVSWWEYLEPTARLNAEMFLATALQNTRTNPQYDILDWWASPGNCRDGQGPGSSYNCHNAQLVVTPQSNAHGGVNNSFYAGFLDANLGSWRQYEWHFKANTPGSNDGASQLYIDGRLAASWSSENFNGNLSMAGMEIDIGGTYTAGAWTTNANGTACAAYASTSYRRWCSPFSTCAPCPIPPDFNRYWDDIIVLKK